MEPLNKILTKLPIVIFAFLYCAWLGYDYYDWTQSPTSELGRRKGQIVTMRTEIDAMKKKVGQGEEFFRNLDVIRSRIRQLAVQLESTKAVLNADIDIANFVRILTLEAKKLKLTMKGIKPEADKKHDYYVDVPFQVQFRGAFVQVLVFLDRIAKFQQVIRISDLNMKPSGNVLTKYVELDGSVKLTAFRYLGTNADDIGKKVDSQTIDYQKFEIRNADGTQVKLDPKSFKNIDPKSIDMKSIDPGMVKDALKQMGVIDVDG